MSQTLEQILKGSKYSLSVFSTEIINKIENSIIQKDDKPYIRCLVKKKDFQANPEECIRQLMLEKLISEYQYPLDLIKVEYSVTFGREENLANIVILNKADKTSVYCVLEIKKPKAKDGKEQLKSYTNATGAPLAVWTNGSEIGFYQRLDPNYFEPLSNIPKASETIDDVKNEKFTYLELMQKDRLSKERKNLKSLITGMEDEVLANAGVDVFEEVLKLIFIKLYDEMESSKDRENIERDFRKLKNNNQNSTLTSKEILDLLLKENSGDDGKQNINNYRELEFRSRGDAYVTKAAINKLFREAKEKWRGIFEEDIKITDENHLQICVAFLQDVKIFNSNLQIVDEAFEYLVNKSAKGSKGQYFTPRNVVDMTVYMINPQPDEYMIDTACGSCGFTVHTLFNVWKKLETQGRAFFSNFSNQDLTVEQQKCTSKVFGIDFDEKSVRVARTLNMISRDGKTNVLHLNTLDYSRWNEKIKDSIWARTYLEGYYNLLDRAKDRANPKEFNFDIVMANPPFAGDIRDKRLISNFTLSEHTTGRQLDKISRDILFIERNLDFLKDGGRMAIVLPQGRFNNTTDKRVRDFIMERARLLAVVGLDVNTFKPHTGTKTSVLFIQKWDENKKSKTYNPQQDDYPIFMAASQNSGKDNSGKEIFETDDSEQRVIDEHGHLIQVHDLEDIAYAFEIWAKEQKLSFWKTNN